MSRENPPSTPEITQASVSKKVPHSKRTIKSHIDPKTFQRKYKVENATKEHGITSGIFISSKSRRDPRIIKYWLEKGTLFESLVRRLYEIQVPLSENWERVDYFLNKKDALDFKQVIDFLYQVGPEYDRHLVECNKLKQLGDKRNADQNEMLGKLANHLNLIKEKYNKAIKRQDELGHLAREVKKKEIGRIEDITIQIVGIIDQYSEDIGLNPTTRNEINFLVSQITEMKNSESVNAAKLVINKLKEISEIYGPAIAVIEKSVELVGGEINRLITDRTTTPKVRLLLESASSSLKVLSRIAHNKNGTKANDLFEFVSRGLEETELKEGIQVDAPFKTLKSKPLKGLYESIITRLFLGDNTSDIKLGNMIIIDHGDHLQVENIDFGNIFIRNYNLDDNLTKPDFLIDCIDEIGKSHQNYDKTQHTLFQSSLQEASNKQEIFDTIKTISKLKDEDLFRITENLKEIVVIQEEEGEKKLVTLVSAKQRKTFFEKLKNRREQMQSLHESITVAMPTIVESDMVVTDFEDINKVDLPKSSANVQDEEMQDEDINTQLHAATIESDEQISPEPSILVEDADMILQEVVTNNNGQRLAPARDVPMDEIEQEASNAAENNQPQSDNVQPQESTSLGLGKRKRGENDQNMR